MRALAAVARHWQLDWSLERLFHLYGKEQEPDARELVRIARTEGLKANVQRTDWAHLARLEKLTPFLVRLANGAWFVVVKAGAAAKSPDGAEQVVLFNPRMPQANLFAISRADFTEHWSGEVILLKRPYRLTDTHRPFSLFLVRAGILAPARPAWRNVVKLAALAMRWCWRWRCADHPSASRSWIDRVLVYLSTATLTVTGGVGVVLAILFDATFNWLRGYFVLRTASRIDIRLARKTFSHLMRLPIGFFDTVTAGVIAKHMQQGSQIREFLTGRLLGTLLDLPALIIFLPLLLWYSPTLTLVVLAVTALLGIVIAAMLGPYRRRLRHLYKAEAQRQSLLVESVHGMRSIKSLNLAPRREEVWDDAAAEAVRTYVQVGKISLAANTFSQFVEKALTVAIVIVGAFLVFQGDLTVGGLVAFNMLAGRVISPVLQVIGLLNNYQEVMMSLDMLGEVMNRPGRE